METKIIKVECCNYSNPVYLRWINDWGGAEYWLFNKINIYDTESKTVASYEKAKEEIITADKLQVTEKEYREGIICSCYFQSINIEGFRQLLRSEQVQLYADSKWLNVDVELVELSHKSDDLFSNITIKIKFARHER
jgi:hypothetical protein